MNVHILIIEGEKTSVEVFPSRKKMVSRRAEVLPTKTRMMPPIPITRDAAGLMALASIVNKIHVDGYEAVLEGYEDD